MSFSFHLKTKTIQLETASQKTYHENLFLLISGLLFSPKSLNNPPKQKEQQRHDKPHLPKISFLQ